MTTFSKTLMEDIKTAMKSKDQIALTTLRALKAALKNAAIAKGGAEAELTHPETLAVVRKQIKQRQDSDAQFTQAGREELAQKERAEIAILEGYLPAPLTEAEIHALVADILAETGADSKAQMGAVMKAAQARAEGRADGKTLSAAVSKALS